MKRLLSLLLAFALLVWALLDGSTPAFAQEKPSGALDFGVNFHYSMNHRSVLGVYARAMAVDRVSGTLVGRFGEIYGSLGVGLDGELIHYSLGAKLGVGLGTDYLVFFLASGLMVDSYTSINDNSKDEQVRPGLGLPLTIGLWFDPMPGLYIYLIAEPSWSFWGKRQTTPFLPFSFAWELRLRGGIGFDVSKIHMRIDYTFHQVAPHSWHVISLGFGFSSKDMANLGMGK